MRNASSNARLPLLYELFGFRFRDVTSGGAVTAKARGRYWSDDDLITQAAATFPGGPSL